MFTTWHLRDYVFCLLIYCSLEQIAQGIWGTSSCGLSLVRWHGVTVTWLSLIVLSVLPLSRLWRLSRLSFPLSTVWTFQLRCPWFWSQETVCLVHSHSRKWPTCVLRVLLESQWDRPPFPRPSDKATAWIEILSLDTWFSRYTRVLSLIPLTSFSSRTCLLPGRVKDGWKAVTIEASAHLLQKFRIQSETRLQGLSFKITVFESLYLLRTQVEALESFRHLSSALAFMLS